MNDVKWELHQIPADEVTAAWVHSISRDHRLVQECPQLAVGGPVSIAEAGEAYYVVEDPEEIVATVIINWKLEGEEAALELVPESKRFQTRWRAPFRSAMAPLWIQLFEHDKLRRVTAWVPESRVRTIRALKTCGFRKEGVKREGVQFVGKEPENLILMGLLALEYIVPEE